MFSYNILRINDSQTHPNPLIYFISTLKSSSRSQQATQKAEEILFRVAAIVYPIMKKNGLKVKSLKEHAWNPVFAGRNFNAGEVIELVLTGRNGAWAHEGYIVSVMLHELSHCLNMNHAKPFWKTLGEFKVHFNSLVQSGYTGEGFWSRGRKMDNMGTAVSGLGMQSVDLPQALCGGAHRRFKKAASFKKFIIKARKTRSERFIEKAGSHGTLLGADFEVRKNLDCGKKPKGPPRVVQSKRGKDLRLNAALARFEQAKSVKSEKNLMVKNETESFALRNETESIAVKNESENLKIKNETLQEKNDNHEQEDEQQDREVQVLDFDQNDFEYGHLYQDEDEDIKTILKQEYEEIFGTPHVVRLITPVSTSFKG